MFCCRNIGFVNAGELYIGDKLLDSNGNILIVEDRKVEILDEPVKVYNFQVEDFHTYHVGENGVLVHNADYSGDLVKVDSPDPAADRLAERIDGESRVRFSNDATGREFDAISDSYVAQSKPADFQLGSSFRNQAKATFEAASQNGKQPYFHFEGPPDPNVLSKISEYASRYGIEPIIDITTLF